VIRRAIGDGGQDAGDGCGVETGDDDGRDAPDGPATTGPFLADAMCGKLAVYLRMCGYDVAYAPDRGVEADRAIARLARAEGRTVLTRDVALAGLAADAVLLRALDVDDQLRELRDAGVRLELADRPARCGDCNGPLDPVPDEEATPADAPDPGETGVWRCRDCGRLFWRGSHWDRVRETLAEL
jgi:hypothetical protein